MYESVIPFTDVQVYIPMSASSNNALLKQQTLVWLLENSRHCAEY